MSFDFDCIRDLAATRGTPFYFYQKDILSQSVSALKRALSDRIEILFSVKANPHPEILSQLACLGVGMDVASRWELQQALQAGSPADRISFAGLYKSPDDIRFALDKHVQIFLVESLREFSLLEDLAKEYGRRVQVILRLHPESYIDSTSTRVERVPSPFGITEEHLSEALTLNRGHEWARLHGLHIYNGSFFLNVEDWIANLSATLTTCVKWQERLGAPMTLINCGGGFGIPYYKDDHALDLGRLGEQLQHLLRHPEFASLSEARLLVESGRFLAGPCGMFVTRVQYRKVSRGKVYVVCDGGFSNHFAAVGPPLHKSWNTVALQCANRSSTEKVTLVGPSCFGLDVLANDVELPELQPGDLVGVPQSGAYGPTFSPQDFLGLKRAEEICR